MERQQFCQCDWTTAIKNKVGDVLCANCHLPLPEWVLEVKKAWAEEERKEKGGK